MKSATAFAPATVGNAGVGFDLLGFSFGVVGDRVTVELMDKAGVEIAEVTTTGPARGAPTESFPRDPARNTAGVPLLEMIAKLGLKPGFRVKIEKGIPLGSGMGGSAASAVAAVVAANALLPHLIARSLSREEQLAFALKGEAVASGSAHADNAAPCLWGGLTLALESGAVVPIPIPAGLYCTLVHPHVVIETRAARALLKPTIGLKDHVRQSGLLSGFLAACYRGDLPLLRASLIDTLIEPQRSVLIPGFDDAKRSAMNAGALGFSISGSGPSVFAWSENAPVAKAVQVAVEAVFQRAGVACEGWSAALDAQGARVVS